MKKISTVNIFKNLRVHLMENTMIKLDFINNDYQYYLHYNEFEKMMKKIDEIDEIKKEYEKINSFWNKKSKKVKNVAYTCDIELNNDLILTIHYIDNKCKIIKIYNKTIDIMYYTHYLESDESISKILKNKGKEIIEKYNDFFNEKVDNNNKLIFKYFVSIDEDSIIKLIYDKFLKYPEKFHFSIAPDNILTIHSYRIYKNQFYISITVNNFPEEKEIYRRYLKYSTYEDTSAYHLEDFDPKNKPIYLSQILDINIFGDEINLKDLYEYIADKIKNNIAFESSYINESHCAKYIIKYENGLLMFLEYISKDKPYKILTKYCIYDKNILAFTFCE